MTDHSDHARNSRPSGRGPTTAGGAVGRAMLRQRVRTITGGAVELEQGHAGGSVVAAVVAGVAYFQTDSQRGLGPALRWAMANRAEQLVLIAEANVAPDLARRAGLLDADVAVWSAKATEVEPATPRPVPEPPVLPPTHQRFAAMISEAGARPIDDHGMLVAEVAGLEVARVVEATGGDQNGRADRTAASGEDPGPRLVVGVGQADRELQEYLHRHLDDDANLRRAIAAVVLHRRPGSATHPLTRFARQRWLRSVLLDDPSLIGASALDAVTPLRPRTTVLGNEPAAAAGYSTVVVCSVGIDLDLLPEAVDYRSRVDPDAELVVVVPERDRRLATSTLAPLVPRLRVESIPTPWAG